MASLTQIRSELEALDAEILALHQTKDSDSASSRRRCKSASTSSSEERRQLRQTFKQHEALYEAAQDPARTFGPNVDSARPSTGDATRDAAMRVWMSRCALVAFLPEHAAEKVERLVTDGSTPSRSIAAQWTVAAGDPAYRSAFAKICARPGPRSPALDAARSRPPTRP